MEKLRRGHPGRHESWRELAEHSLTHDQYTPCRRRTRWRRLIPRLHWHHRH